MNKINETIGVYTFVTKNWKEIDLPLDLWVEWHLKFFDQIAICTYGHVNFLDKYKNNKKIIIKQIDTKTPKTLKFFTIPETIAMHALTTDWKVGLDIDHFLGKRININNLNKKFAYPIICHDLYGNLNTEKVVKVSWFYPLIYGKKEMQFRIHYKNRKLLGDGALTEMPYKLKKSLFKNLLYFLLKHIPKQFMENMEKRYSNKYKHRLLQNLLKNYKLNSPYQEFEVWHTSAVRRPEAYIKRTNINGQKYLATKNFEGKNNIKEANYLFNYKDKKNYNKLIHVDSKNLPSILLKNKSRFNHVKFNNIEK